MPKVKADFDYRQPQPTNKKIADHLLGKMPRLSAIKD